MPKTFTKYLEIMDDNKLLEFWKMYIVQQENRSRGLYSTIYKYIYRIQPKLFLQSLVRTHFFMQFFSQHEFAAKHKILFTCICIIMYNNNKRYYQELVFWHYQNPIIYQLSIMITVFTLFCTGYIYNIFSNCN